MVSMYLTQYSQMQLKQQQQKQQTQQQMRSMLLSWPENQGILFFYISQTFQINRISFMASHINAVL